MKTTLLLATLMSFGAVAAAQSPTNPSRKAEALRAQADAKKQEAVSLARAKGLTIRKEFPDGTVFELVRLRGGRPSYLRTFGFEAADTIGADELWPGSSTGLNLTGSGINLGVWDAGRADGTHREFLTSTGTRVTYADSATVVNNHSTHVAGIMAAAGLDTAARGMSFAAGIRSYDWNSDTSEMISAAAAGLVASNHSYGYITGWSNNFRGDGRWTWFGDPSISPTTDWQFGFYSDEAKQLDQVLFDYPNYLAVWAAGNSRGGGPSTQPVEHWVWSNTLNNWQLSTARRDLNGGAAGYDSLTIGPPVAKNDLVVAAVSPITGGYTSPSGVAVAGFSSAGPTDDGRIKPDVAAPGVNIYSTLPNGTYGRMSGTSMATPAVTGAIGQLAEQFRSLYGTTPLSSTIKALLIHTADSTTTAPGPNYRTGWGLVNARTAAQTLATDASRRDVIFERSLSNGSTISIPIVSDGSGPLKATIVWTDPAGTVAAPSLNSPTPKLVNDLDLRIQKDGQTYSPWILDPLNPSLAATTGDNFRDNVEQVSIPSPSAGTYTINISAKNANLLPSGAQRFTLIVTGHRTSRLSSLVATPSTVVGDGTQTSVGKVTLDSVAPRGGALVSLTRTGPVSVPATVTVAEGSSTANFTITAAAVTADQSASVTATYGGSSVGTALTVKAPVAAGTGTGLLATYYQDAGDGKYFTTKVLERTEGGINFSTGGSIAPGVTIDNASARWVGLLEAPVSGTYTISTVSDDGVRVWLDGKLIIENWTKHAATTNSATVSLVANKKYDLKIEYFEATSTATLRLLWSYPGVTSQIIPTERLYGPVGDGLLGTYYNDPDSGSFFTTQVLQRIEPGLNYAWQGGSPAPGVVQADHFSARYTGQVLATETGTYTFSTVSDDGIRVWVNGQLLINNWTNHGATTNSGTISLVANQKYDIKIEYYDQAWSATLKLLWQTPTATSSSLIPQSVLFSK